MRNILIVLFLFFVLVQQSAACVRPKQWLENFDLTEIQYMGFMEDKGKKRVLIKTASTKIPMYNPATKEYKKSHINSDVHSTDPSALISKYETFIIEVEKNYITVVTPYIFYSMNPPDMTKSMSFDEFQKLDDGKKLEPRLVSCNTFPKEFRYISNSMTDCLPLRTCYPDDSGAYMQRLYIQAK